MDAAYTSGAFTDPDNLLSAKSDSRIVVNAQVTYEMDDIQAGFYVRNLFDNEYVTQRFLNNGATNARTGEPLTVGFFVTKTF